MYQFLCVFTWENSQTSQFLNNTYLNTSIKKNTGPDVSDPDIIYFLSEEIFHLLCKA